MPNTDKLRGSIAATLRETSNAASQTKAKAKLVDGLSLAVAAYLVDDEDSCDVTCHCQSCALHVQPPISSTELTVILFANLGLAFLTSSGASSQTAAKNGLVNDIADAIELTVDTCRLRHACPTTTFVEYPPNAKTEFKASVKQAFSNAEKSSSQTSAILALSSGIANAIETYVGYCIAGLTICGSFQPDGATGGKGGGEGGGRGKGEEPTGDNAIAFSEHELFLEWLLGSTAMTTLNSTAPWQLTAIDKTNDQ